MKRFVPALAAALLLSGGAYAQSINIGPGGVSVDPRTPRERHVDREIRREERRDRYERDREREYRAKYRGERCRTVTTRDETPRGVVRRTTRVCDGVGASQRRLRERAQPAFCVDVVDLNRVAAVAPVAAALYSFLRWGWSSPETARRNFGRG